MKQLLEYLERQEGLSVEINPMALNIVVSSQDEATNLIVIRDGIVGQSVIEVADGARLNILEIVTNGAQSDIQITQGASSQLHSTLIELGGSEVTYKSALDGKGAELAINILQLTRAKEVAKVELRIEHNSANCTSRSLSKAVATESSQGVFHGLIYVAEGAQATLAEQNSRNILLGNDARIIADPQLEIYADDVKCTHGATVGQMNHEAIYYMMQRGISEEQARKLQLEGFARDITQHCAIDEVCDALAQMVEQWLDRL